ncbi:hypothetical protein CBR_g88547 [Chara braunii]|uniref:Myb-like domain-containing protein n=1 Tax=Chara braunii TaxID=69332 RepID=A0A388KB23_CHABU|nr:hypothetical protein CBR_g88547 [Chara braunii]|eukprot:GBG67258.1 hypothetical protein CBR_g88547 [Chara braunii]
MSSKCAYREPPLACVASINVGVGASSSDRHQGKNVMTAQGSRDSCPPPAGFATGLVRIDSDRLPMSNQTTTTQADVRDDTGCKSPLCHRAGMENITRGVSNMWAHNDGGIGDAAYRDDDNDGDTKDIEVGDDDGNIDIWSLGKRAGRAKGRGRGGGRGRSGGRGGRGGASKDGAKSATYRTTKEQMLLVRCKREQDMHMAGMGHNYGRMRTRDWKWEDIAKQLAALGTVKDANDCFRKWDNLFHNYNSQTAK